MTNIILGNMAVGIIAIIIGNIPIYNAVIRCIIRVIMAVLATSVSYILGRRNYSVKKWKVVLLGAINIVISYTLSLTGWWIPVAIATMAMGASLAYIIAASFDEGLFFEIAVHVGTLLPYALICLGITIGRRKNREQYEAFLESEKEKKERKKACRGKESKEDDGVI